LRIEDYALIGDTHTAALVSRMGSIDWMCTPRFDSAACFAALLGDEQNGSWSIAPAQDIRSVTRRYLPDTLVVETTFETATGIATLTDALALDQDYPRVVRAVRGVSGFVDMHFMLRLRFDYGSIVPWVRGVDDLLCAVAGPDAMVLYSDVETHGEDFATVADFTIAHGKHRSFELAYHPSHLNPPAKIGAEHALEHASAWWQKWAERCTYRGEFREAVVRSLITLKALTYSPTGAIAAAPTTSLPEHIGGVRNWDYRFCWLRDATFALLSFINAGYDEEAGAWRAWLLRAIAGAPQDVQIMYGLRGERRIGEVEIDWLAGYEDSKPVRTGNAAVDQFQLDVFGEVIDVMFASHNLGLPAGEDEWALTRMVIEAIENRWRAPDRGLWEVRGPDRHFVHSKVLAWVAFDRAVKATDQFGLAGSRAQWVAIRDEIHAQVCERGFDPVRNTFTQSYGSRELDAATLLIPLVGFLPPDDPRVRGTIGAIERELMRDGFIQRYTQTESETDGLPPGEGAFLACNFWLIDNYALVGRETDARALFARMLAIRNDVGLLAEEYDPIAQRQLGNYPQAFSHVGLINSATNLERSAKAPPMRMGPGLSVEGPI